jgi:hypothetical protein
MAQLDKYTALAALEASGKLTPKELDSARKLFHGETSAFIMPRREAKALVTAAYLATLDPRQQVVTFSTGGHAAQKTQEARDKATRTLRDIIVEKKK